MSELRPYNCRAFFRDTFLSTAVAAGIAILSSSGTAMAEEGGSGHYLPGSMASFVDGVPLDETFIVRLNVLNYDGSISADRKLPIAGLSTLGAEANSWGYGLTMLWRPPLELGERWSYAMSTTIPYVTLRVTADVETEVAGSRTAIARRSSSVSGLGDILLMPLMLNFNVNPDFNINFRLTAYAPTGGYEVGRLANTGKNFWTLEPTVAFMYLGQKNGIEGSLFIGADFNQENPDTDYKSGTQFHFDSTLSQHFPFAGGVAGAGVTGYYYEQITGDSGAGATFGDFKAKTAGVGPVLSYSKKAGANDLIAELKWLHEVQTKNRLQGDTVFLKVLMKF
ncbi:MAG: transporter [Pseudomonadota bacterium]|nr:transporter [Pseudomonadota bacterium]